MCLPIPPCSSVLPGDAEGAEVFLHLGGLRLQPHALVVRPGVARGGGGALD